jgi:serine/threonine-protein kinase
MPDLAEIKARLTQSDVMTAQKAAECQSAWQAETRGTEEEGERFVAWLAENGLLTQFQADAVLAGHSVPLMLGPYRVYEAVVAGRLGGVFRAVHQEFEQPVSIKIFPSATVADPEKFARMGRELRVSVELLHPNVLRAFQVGRAGDLYYLAMEDLHGETLAARLERKGYLPLDEACRIGRDVAQGLAHLHDNGVVHRDVRPENIWITWDGVPKLMEFGAARDAFAALDVVPGAGGPHEVTAEDATIGDIHYVSPEQARDARNATPQSDLYSLGSVLYHCLAGRPPFEDDNPMRLALKLAGDEPQKISQLNQEVPEAMDDTMAGLLAKKPEDRFAKARHVVMALDPFVPHETETVEVVPVNPQFLAWCRAHEHQGPAMLPDQAEGVSPELAVFLEWMGERERRRGHGN